MASGSKEAIKRIQHELARRGFDPGVNDGIWGRRTEDAVRRFQASQGLLADGIVGPVTSLALLKEEVAHPPFDFPAMPWFQEARRLIGVKEAVGPSNNPQILQWADKTGIAYKSDDIAWCGLFVSHCMSAALSKEPLPRNPLGARDWIKFGAPCEPIVGSILVFWRDRPAGWKGHVGFYAGEDDSAFHVLGGNQSNSVSIARIRFDRLLEARWPASAPIISPGKVKIASNETMFSTNEA